MLKKNITLDRKSMKLISLFNNISGAIIKDCVFFQAPNNSSEIIIFLVKKEDVGKAIGRGGENVKDLRKKLQKKIDVIPFSENLEEFIRFILKTTKKSIRVEKIEIKGSNSSRKTVVISVDPKDRGKAIGKKGSMIKKIKLLVLRHFDVDNVIINTKNY